jgi:serine phosphatase RsbU (regulator of sigma subunit)
MDIALCKINLKQKLLHYSGAHRPLFLLRNKELLEYKGERKAIGGIPHPKKEEKDFTNYLIDIRPGDKAFFFSDGMPDQIGGEDGRKYSPNRIRELIINNYQPAQWLSITKSLKKILIEYMGDFKQIDDVL